MGSFYLTCSISNMTLSHQKTSIQLLLPKYNTSEYSSLGLKDHMGSICSNDGSQAFFSPFGFPVHGFYDDCGNISDIVRDKGVEQLEDFFGISIEDIISNIGCVDKGDMLNIKNEDLYLSLGITFFRTEVLGYLERGWDEVDLINPLKYSGEGYLKWFLDGVSSTPDKDVIDDIILRKRNGDKLTEDDLDIYFESLSGYGEIWSKCYIKCNIESNFLKILPIDFISQEDDIIKQWSFLKRLSWVLNRVLLPSVYGGQETNFIETYELNEFVNDLLIVDIEEEDDYNDLEDERSVSIIKSHNRNKSLRDLGI